VGKIITSSLRVSSNETTNHADFVSLVHNCHLRIGSATTNFYSVQEAVDVAQPGDEVKVAGRCMGINERFESHQQVYIDKSITVRGGYTTTNWTDSDPIANPTILDATWQGPVIVINGPVSTTIEALHLTQGSFDYKTGRIGCIHAVDANVMIKNNLIDHCYRGMNLIESEATIVGTQVISNSVWEDYGAGLFVRDSNVILNRNIISGNFCGSFLGGCGAILWIDNSQILMDGNTFNENSDDHVLIANVSRITMTRNIIKNNTTRRVVIRFNGSISHFENNLFANNSSGFGFFGLHKSHTQMIHNTFARNRGFNGIALSINDSTAALTNTILVSHTTGVLVSSGSTATMEATLWGSGAWANDQDWAGDGTIITGTINIWGNPDFVNPDAGDYHLSPLSEAINAGIDAGVKTDIDGQYRPQGGAYDIGADEFYLDEFQLYLPLILNSSSPVQVTPLSSRVTPSILPVSIIGILFYTAQFLSHNRYRERK
jgi:hypothetical protein